MSEIIRRFEEPTAPVSISKTVLEPQKPTDNPSMFVKFVNFVRQNIGLKPLELAERFAEAEARKREAQADSFEVDNQVKLLKAKQEYELVQAEIRRMDMEAAGKSEQAKEEAKKICAKTRSARISHAAEAGGHVARGGRNEVGDGRSGH